MMKPAGIVHPRDFISEDDLSTFEGWLKYQGFDAAQLSPEVPRGDRGWTPHTTYHLDCTLHMKSFGHKLSRRRNAEARAKQDSWHNQCRS